MPALSAARTYTTGYAYQAGELSSITYPSGRVVSQSYDTIGRLAKLFDSVNTYASGFGYNTASELTGFAYGNGVTASFGYSPDRLQLTSLAYTKGTSTLFSLGYNYGAAGSNNGQIASVTDNADAGRTVSYTYDNLARLASAVTNGDTSYPKWGLSFSYDRYGNRTAQTVTAGSAPSNSVTVDQTTNRITGSPYAYDANGNMTNDGLNNSMVYDAENRLVSINSGSATYSYDGKSLRVKRVAGGTTTVYIYSGLPAVAGTRVIAEYENGAAPGAPTREYIYSGSQLLAKVEGGATNYYHADQLSVRLMTDSSGNIVGQQGHYPFGESWYQTSTTTKWLLTGGVYPERSRRERDSESGNAFFASRMGLRDDYATFRYDVNRLGRPDAFTDTGRSVLSEPDRFAPAQRPRDVCMPGQASPDLLAGSAADPQSLNRYAYVRDDPVNLVDPLGLDCNWWNGDTPECENGAGPGTYYDAFGYCAPQYEYCWSSGWDWPSWNERCTWEDRDGPPRLLVCFQPAGSETSGLGDTDPGHGGGGGIGNLPLQRKIPTIDLSAQAQACSQHGFGAGVVAGGTAELGVGPAGVARTWSVGAGVYHSGPNGYSTGAFGEGGLAAYAGPWAAGAPTQGQAPASGGAYAGAGAGVFVTNAGSNQQLYGPFRTYSLDVGFGPSLSFQFAVSTNGTWIASVTVGPGAIAGGAALTTNTATTGGRCP